MPETETKLTKSILIFLFTVVLFDMIGATILVTVQAFIVKQYNSTALAVSLLIIIYAAAQFIAAPILGRISDRYGQKTHTPNLLTRLSNRLHHLRHRWRIMGTIPITSN